MSETNTLYKLMILYMLRKIDFALPYVRIADFVLEKGYTDYFTLQSALAQLEEAGLIHVEVISDSSYYLITPDGQDMINLFLTKVSPSIREDIDAYLTEQQISIRNDVSVLSDYYLNTHGEYEIRCQIRENQSSLLDMTLTVPDQEMAAAISGQWKKKSQDIYAYLMNELMTKGEQE